MAFADRTPLLIVKRRHKRSISAYTVLATRTEHSERAHAADREAQARRMVATLRMPRCVPRAYIAWLCVPTHELPIDAALLVCECMWVKWGVSSAGRFSSRFEKGQRLVKNDWQLRKEPGAASKETNRVCSTRQDTRFGCGRIMRSVLRCTVFLLRTMRVHPNACKSVQMYGFRTRF